MRLATFLIRIILEKNLNDINREELAVIPHPIYLHHLYPMALGLLNESDGKLVEALANYGLSRKKVQSNCEVDISLIDSRINFLRG